METAIPARQQQTIFLVLTAIFTSLTTVATVSIIIPFPTSTGYLNFGDVLVMLSGLLLGPFGGFFAGGIGSALADVISGYVHFAPITFLVKGLEGMTVGYISMQTRNESRLTSRDVIGLIFGSLVMLSGYLIAEIPLVGLESAIAELVSVNLLQVTVGSIIVMVIGPRMRAFLRNSIHSKIIS